jgi:hypothetical protein
MDPLMSTENRRPRISHDPNIVYLEVDCSGDKTSGARDIIEVKVN